jgi:4-amino-4-deoxy-L-arabinose transferase-like glycosyltransferase
MDSLFQFLSRNSLIISLVWLALLFILFYPARFVNIDEHDYLQNADLIIHSQLRQECDGSESQYQVNDYCISKYNIGTSLFLIPAALTNPALAFAISFAVFVIGIVIFNRLLKLLAIDPVFTYLYALFPAFVYYSRTLMSETYSATLIITIAYCLLRMQKSSTWWGIAAGVLTGVAVLVRYTNILPIALLILLALIWRFRTEEKALVKSMFAVAAGALPWMLVFITINIYLYGAPLRSGYYFSGEEGVFIWSQVPLFLLRFGFGLSAIYPLMLELPLFIRSRFSWLLVPVLATMLFYAGFPNTTFEGRPLDLILGLRFLVPVIPLLLIAYTAGLNRLVDKQWFKLGLVIAGVSLGGLSLLLSYQHQQFLLA